MTTGGADICGRGFDSTDFPTSINVNNFNGLNDVLAPRRGIATPSKINELDKSGKEFLSIVF
jgi:hypothetical protein